MPVWMWDTLRSVSRSCRAGGSGRDRGDLHHKNHRVLVLVAERTANHVHRMSMHHSLQTLTIHRQQLISCLKMIKYCKAIQQVWELGYFSIITMKADTCSITLSEQVCCKIKKEKKKKNNSEKHTGIKPCTLFPAGCWRQWANRGALRKGTSSDVISGCQGCTCLMHSSSVKVRKHIARRRQCWLLYLHLVSHFLSSC